MASHKLLVVTTLILSMLACAVQAQDDYPSRPLHIIVGFTPGGGPDITPTALYTRIARAGNITSQ